jgi:hypothetical protein
MGRAEEGKAATEHHSDGWKAAIDGRVVQLLETSTFQR